MDFVNKLAGGNNNNNNQNQGSTVNQQGQSSSSSSSGGGFLGGIGDKLNTAAGGGRESEKNEDMLDKGKCFFFAGFLALCPFSLNPYSISYPSYHI